MSNDFQIQQLCTTFKEINCMKNIEIDYSECSEKCQGLDIISFEKMKHLKWKRYINSKRDIEFDSNPELTRYISKLSDQYNQYKDSFKSFPLQHKSIHLNDFFSFSKFSF